MKPQRSTETDFKIGEMCTYTGKKFAPLNPDPDLIDIRDIAHALAYIGRYGGHAHKFISVADHSIRVTEKTSDENKLWALLHDASEAYLGDIPAPLKHSPEFSFYRDAEKNLMDAICDKFGLEKEEPKEIKYWDLVIRATEMRDLTSIPMNLIYNGDTPPLEEKFHPISSLGAETAFLSYATMLGIYDG